jgi:hypothetical protein
MFDKHKDMADQTLGTVTTLAARLDKADLDFSRLGVVMQTTLGPPLKWTMLVYRTDYRDYSDMWGTVQDGVYYKAT